MTSSVLVRWDERREWRAEDGPREPGEHKYESHDGVVIVFLDRMEILRASGGVRNWVIAIIYDNERKILVEQRMDALKVLGLVELKEPDKDVRSADRKAKAPPSAKRVPPHGANGPAKVQGARQ